MPSLIIRLNWGQSTPVRKTLANIHDVILHVHKFLHVNIDNICHFKNTVKLFF